jgi:hypothetical protein
MRTPLEIPQNLIRDAQLYAPTRDALDAVCFVLGDYPRLVAEARDLRRRVAQLDDEGAALDARLADLQAICRSILDI